MKFSVKFLKNVANVNTFQYTSQWSVSEGYSHVLHFQITDKLKDDLRYLSQADEMEVSVIFLSFDETTEIIKTASQAFVDDRSIWTITLESDEVPNSGAIKIMITEDGVEKIFRIDFAIVVDLLESGGC
jgi:hypothetical protein